MYYNKGWIEVITGPMFSGKTEELIRRLKRVQYARQSSIVFKPAVDTRYSLDKIVSHSGLEIPSVVPKVIEEIVVMYESKKYDVVAFDEIQLFPRNNFDNTIDMVDLINRMADEGTRVIVAGLDMDFRGKPFGIIKDLLCVAEKVDKLTSICNKCGALATRTQRIIDGKPAHYNDPTVLVGATDYYIPVCRDCHEVRRN